MCLSSLHASVVENVTAIWNRLPLWEGNRESTITLLWHTIVHSCIGNLCQGHGRTLSLYEPPKRSQMVKLCRGGISITTSGSTRWEYLQRCGILFAILSGPTHPQILQFFCPNRRFASPANKPLFQLQEFRHSSGGDYLLFRQVCLPNQTPPCSK